MTSAKPLTKLHGCLQVEQLLETYFMNVDNTYNKLQTLGEYIDDTEDYIQFDLDTKRNKFIEVCCAPSLMGQGGLHEYVRSAYGRGLAEFSSPVARFGS